MDTQKSTSNTPKNPESNVKSSLTWRYFKSLHETILAASFASAPLEDNPHFIEIDEIEYNHLVKEMQS